MITFSINKDQIELCILCDSRRKFMIVTDVKRTIFLYVSIFISIYSFSLRLKLISMSLGQMSLRLMGLGLK